MASAADDSNLLAKAGAALPALLTLLNLSCGATAIPLTIGLHWEAAVACLIASSLLDAMDGFIARRLKLDSEYGTHLDSLADLISFGVSPALIIHMWSLTYYGPIGWALSLAFILSSAVRLARFTSSRSDPNRPLSHTFSGVPTLAASALILVPLMMSFQFESDYFRATWINATLTVVASILMLTSLPTPSLYISLPYLRSSVLILALLPVGMTMCGLGWTFATAAILLYYISIPLFFFRNGFKARCE